MNTTARSWLKTGAIGLAGLAAGGVLATTVAATAEDSADGDTPSQTDSRRPGSGEEVLTGDTADQVRDAALAEYPGATVLRLETDSDGVYEAHLVKADGTPVTLEVDEDFEVTGEEEGGFGHGSGGRGDFGGDGSDDGAPQSSTV